MAITSLAQVVSGLQAPVWIAKNTSALNPTGPFISSWQVAGNPVAGSESVSLAGSALSNPTTGGLPWSDPTSGNAYLARLQLSAVANSNAGSGMCLLADRLWQNGGMDETGVSGSQTVGSPTWPARDVNGATTGTGVLLGLEVSTATTGTVTPPTVTVSYTNTSGTSGQTATNVGPMALVSSLNVFYTLSLAAGDVGVQSVQSVSFSTTGWTGGVVNLVAYRPIAILDTLQARTTAIDAATGAMPRLYPGSVLFVLIRPTQSSVPFPIIGEAQFTWG
jgi:hypothetical protein